ncbi:LemA family protein [Fluviicola chungangensis]|uniref:LemA family protein n=1 Tax=Fluviicola chungangensis TaxID=2597671 RepID=A0A556N2E8_9FLAO|nr:LemA family protein [Fluviicola chungangensis]TSJ46367.1 LemA family protein [Fluviicola chungangensis]
MIFLLTGGALLFAVLLIFLILRNQLIRSRNLVDAAFADMDVQLLKRHELIPKLVQIAAGYAKHEAVLLEELAEKRTGIWDKDDQFPQILTKINAIKEAYPDLKADQTFEKLLFQITETQNHLLYSRQFYNGTVEAYNSLQEKIPYSWFAKSNQHTKRNYVQAKSEQHEIPKYPI